MAIFGIQRLRKQAFGYSLLVFVIIGIIGAMVAYDNFVKNNDHLLSESKLSELSQMSIGADMATLDYASEDRVIFHYNYALIAYSLKEERIIRALDLSTLNVPINTQGDTVISVQATADGNNLIIGANGMPEVHDTYIYNIEKNSVKKIKAAVGYQYQIFTGLSDMDYENIFNWSSYHCVWLSETKRCYLLLKDSFHVSSITIIVEDGEELTEYTVFEDAYANAAAMAKTILDEICMRAGSDADASDYLAENKSAFDNISALSKMDEISEKVNGILDDYVREIQNHIHIDKAILYGSYAKGDYNEYSDVDIVIFLESFKGKTFVEIASFLFGLARKYMDVCLEPVGFSVSDLQDNNPFIKEVINTGRELYIQ